MKLRRLVALSALAVGCSSAPSQPVTSPVTTIAAPPPAVAAATFPAKIDDTSSLVPIDAPWVVEIPAAAKLDALLTPAQHTLVTLGRMGVEDQIAERLGFEKELVGELIDAFGGASLFGDGGDAVGAIVRVSSPEAVEKLLRNPLFEKKSNEAFAGATAVLQLAGTGATRLVWYAAPRLLVLASSEKVAASVHRIGASQARSFVDNPRRPPADASAVRAFGDLASLARGEKELRGLLDAGSEVRFELAGAQGGIHSKTAVAFVGPRVPRVANVLDVHATKLAARLPEETVFFGTISLARKSGRKLADLVGELARATPLAAAADTLAQEGLGVGLDALDAELGDELTFGALADPSMKLTAGKDPDRGALFVLAETRTEAQAKSVLASVAKTLKGAKGPAEKFKIVTSPTSIRFTPKKPKDKGPSMRVEAHGALVVFDVGVPDWLDRVSASLDKGERTLGKSPSFQASPSLASASNAVFWFDASKLLSLAGLGGMAGPPALTRVNFGGADKGLTVTVEGDNEVALLGAGSALAVYGVRRYLANAKTSEAKNTIGAIARGAISAWERETVSSGALKPGASVIATHQLCKSANPVPLKVPAGIKYQPSSSAGADFETGDNLAGWRCLRFSMTSPHYYQYEYRQGGAYKGPARGGPDPGKDGFEVSAEGDLNGDGKTSLFTVTGTIDKKTNEVKLSPMFTVDEAE